MQFQTNVKGGINTRYGGDSWCTLPCMVRRVEALRVKPPDPTPAIVQGARSKQLLASNLDRNVERISIPVGSMGFYLLIYHKNQLN